jgi:predicted aspartyl protease
MQTVPLTIVPDPDDASCADVLVDVTVGGRSYRVVLDTGAAHTHLVADEHTADLPVVQCSSSAGALAVGRDELVTVQGVRLGPIAVASLDVVRVPGEQPDARHLVGMDVLRDWCLEVSLSRGLLQIGTPSTAHVPTVVQALEMDDRGHSYVGLTWSGVVARACWDTGAGITVVDAAFAEGHPELFDSAGSAYGIDSTGTRVETPILTMCGPEIGGALFADHRVAVVDLGPANATLEIPMDLIVGYPTIVQADWWLDFPGRRWGFVRRPGEPQQLD